MNDAVRALHMAVRIYQIDPKGEVPKWMKRLAAMPTFMAIASASDRAAFKRAHAGKRLVGGNGGLASVCSPYRPILLFHTCRNMLM